MAMDRDEFVGEVQRRGELTGSDAEALVRATLEELAEALTVEQANRLAGQLPDPLREWLRETPPARRRSRVARGVHPARRTAQWTELTPGRGGPAGGAEHAAAGSGRGAIHQSHGTNAGHLLALERGAPPPAGR